MSLQQIEDNSLDRWIEGKAKQMFNEYVKSLNPYYGMMVIDISLRTSPYVIYDEKEAKWRNVNLSKEIYKRFKKMKDDYTTV